MLAIASGVCVDARGARHTKCPSSVNVRAHPTHDQRARTDDEEPPTHALTVASLSHLHRQTKWAVMVLR